MLIAQSVIKALICLLTFYATHFPHPIYHRFQYFINLPYKSQFVNSISDVIKKAFDIKISLVWPVLTSCSTVAC